MKILYISKVDISQTDGPGVNERGFIPLLYKLKGKKTHFLIPQPQDNLPDDIPVEAVTFFKSSFCREPLPWIKQQIDLFQKANRILNEKKIDLIIIRPEIFDFAFNRLLKKNQIPYALKTAGSGKFKVFKRKNILWRSLYRINQKQFIKLIKGSILTDVVSQKQQDSIRELSGEKEKILWIDNGVDINRFIPRDKIQAKKEMDLDRFDPIIGYAGNFPWKRGGMQMVKALPRLKMKYPKIGIVSLGSGEGIKMLVDKAKEFGVEDRCVFTGQIPYELVDKYINCFDVGISQLYKEEQGASEQKVRQYLACGKPVIVSPGGVNDFVEEDKLGSIIDPLDENGFYQAIDHLLSLDKEQYQNLSKRIRKYAEKNLSYESKVQERLGLYKRIIEK